MNKFIFSFACSTWCALCFYLIWRLADMHIGTLGAGVFAFCASVVTSFVAIISFMGYEK